MLSTRHLLSKMFGFFIKIVVTAFICLYIGIFLFKTINLSAFKLAQIKNKPVKILIAINSDRASSEDIVNLSNLSQVATNLHYNAYFSFISLQSAINKNITPDIFIDTSLAALVHASQHFNLMYSTGIISASTGMSFVKMNLLLFEPIYHFTSKRSGYFFAINADSPLVHLTEKLMIASAEAADTEELAKRQKVVKALLSMNSYKSASVNKEN